MRITEIGPKRWPGSPAGAALLSRSLVGRDQYGGNNVLGCNARVATGAFARLAGAKPGAPEHKPRNLKILQKGIRDVSPVVVGDARRGALHILHQSVKIVA